MKTLAFICLVLIGFMGSAYGADVTMKWDAVVGATGYVIQMSTDTGATWPTADEVDVGNVTTYVKAGVPDSGLVLFRIKAYDASDSRTRTDAGCWYNGDWSALGCPGGAGIQ